MDPHEKVGTKSSLSERGCRAGSGGEGGSCAYCIWWYVLPGAWLVALAARLAASLARRRSSLEGLFLLKVFLRWTRWEEGETTEDDARVMTAEEARRRAVEVRAMLLRFDGVGRRDLVMAIDWLLELLQWWLLLQCRML